MSNNIAAIHSDICASAMDEIERTQKRFGIKHWKASVVLRNPDPAKSGEWLIVTNDDPVAVAQTITQRGTEHKFTEAEALHAALGIDKAAPPPAGAER